jgi:hypothetical protein
MAIKTFTTGEVLTAADTNTYLANSGLVFVSSTTVGSAVSSVTVSDAFSATYDNYLIVLSGGASTGETNLPLRLGSKTTNYKAQLIYVNWGSTILAVGSSTATSFTYAASSRTNGMQGAITLINPFLAKNTYINSTWQADADTGFNTGQTNDTTSYTAFTFLVAGGTITGGTITVYGYRKA